VAILDHEIEDLFFKSLAPRSVTAYRLALVRWRAFTQATELSEGVLRGLTARQREQWALRFQVWEMRRGTPPKAAAQVVYNASAALRGVGLGSLLELNVGAKHSRVGAIRKGAERRAETVHGGDGVLGELGIRAEREKGTVCRPLTDWELRLVQQWWLTKSGEPREVAERWNAILTLAYYACWRPSQFTRPSVPGIPWQRWLVRRAAVRTPPDGVGWRVKTQKTGKAFNQFFFEDGPAKVVGEALEVLMETPPGTSTRHWICWLHHPNEPVTYSDLLMLWGIGVQGAGLAPGVETPYALRRGGATFWSRVGLTWQQVGAANGWRSGVVRRYIMTKRWLAEPILAPSARATPVAQSVVAVL